MNLSSLQRACLTACLYLVLTNLFVSCKKNIDTVSQVTLSHTKTKDDLPYSFDWINNAYLPTSPTQVLHMPWYGSVGGVNANLASDINVSDGWFLIYNTFSPTTSPYLATMPPGGLYFALYNKYRGLLRFYLYLPPGIATPSSNITHGLSLNSASGSSPMLNFEGAAQGSDLVDANTSTAAISKINNQQVSALGNWCVMQYEIAYDPNINQTSYPNFGLTWFSKSVSVSEIDLQGSQIGTITGQITQPAGGFNLGSTLTQLAIAGIEVYGLSDVSSLQNSSPAPQGTQASFLSGLSSAVSGGLGNTITGLLSGIFGGNSSNSQEVNLTMNTTIKISGSLTNSTGLTTPNFVIPGQLNASTANGPNPAYVDRLGVFNFAARPIVNAHAVNSTFTVDRPSGDGSSTHPATYTTYTIPTTTINSLLINPAVLNSATISSETFQVTLVNPTNLIPATAEEIVTNGVKATIGNDIVYSAATFARSIGAGSTPGGTIAVKVSFRVIPNGQTTGPLLVKTFIANVVPI